MKMNSIMYVAVLSVATSVSQAAVWITPIKGGEVRFDDWGYTGPGGRTADDFAPINGFGKNILDPEGGVGQIQHVITQNPDRLTQDPVYDILMEFSNLPGFYDTNMDGQVNFFNWGYTTTAGSTFSNMLIDYDGDYFIKRSDMSFNLYNTFDYQNEGNNSAAMADGIYPTSITFKPYALSDASGWCGSILSSSPAALEAMAGQVTFDFGMDTFLFGGAQGYMQVVPGFQMRSYGTLEVVVTAAAGGNGDIHYIADAVVNNTSPAVSAVNPGTGLKEVGGGGVDEAYYNTVSFMGGGIVPEGSWVLVPVGSNIPDLGNGSYALTNENILKVLGGEEAIVPEIPLDPDTGLPMDGELLYHKNYFAGFTFLMRADGKRYVDGFDFEVYSNFSGIPASAYNANNELVNLEGTVIRDLSAPFIELFSPVQAAVKSFVGIHGDNFCDHGVCDINNTRIMLDGLGVRPQILTDTMAYFYVPVGVDEDSRITIKTSTGETATSADMLDMVVVPPTIHDIVYGAYTDPHEARVGDYVVIKGSNFCSSECLIAGSSEATVCFDGMCSLAAWTGWDIMTVRVPEGVSPGLASVSVTAPGGTVTRADLLTIIP